MGASRAHEHGMAGAPWRGARRRCAAALILATAGAWVRPRHLERGPCLTACGEAPQWRTPRRQPSGRAGLRRSRVEAPQPDRRSGCLRKVSRGASSSGSPSSSSEAQLVSLWRAERRSRALKDLDWTRYHLWVYFVDALEPSYARARLCRFFFEKVCYARDSSSLLYCAAGGVQPALHQEVDLTAASVVPGLHASDLQNLMVPPYEFAPADMSMYDLVVAADEQTQEAVRAVLAADGRQQQDPDHLCLLEDFLDAYEVMLANEGQQDLQPVEEASIRPGMLTAGSLRNLNPGQPLRGAPPSQRVGPPLEYLPEVWEKVLWPAAGDCNEIGEATSSDLSPTSAQRRVGRMLRSVVGLERALRGSIPEGMRWWNDEE